MLILFSLFTILVNCEEYLGKEMFNQKTSLVDLGPGIGLAHIVKHDIHIGEYVLGIPTELTIDSVSEYEWTPFVSSLKTDTRLALRIIWEVYANKDPFFVAYYNKVLADHDQLVFWTSQEKQALLDYCIEYYPETNWDYIQHTYDEAYKALSGNSAIAPEVFDFKIWRRAMGLGYSHFWPMTAEVIKKGKNQKVELGDELKAEFILFPYLDYVNHYPHPQNRHCSYQNIRFKDGNAYFTAVREFKPGMEFSFDYACAESTNFFMLLFYGFTMEVNVWERIYIRKSDENCTEQRVNGTCRWSIGPMKLNSRLLEYHYNENRLKQLAEYKKDILAFREKSKYSLRSLRRLRTEETSSRMKLAMTYGISQHLVALEQVKLVDRTVMQDLLDKLSFRS